MLGLTLPVVWTRTDGLPSGIEGRQKVTLIRRFAGITPEVVENVRTGEKMEGWLDLSHALLASLIGAKPEHAGVGGPIALPTSAGAAVGDGYRPGGSVIPHRRGGVLLLAKNGVRTQIDPAMCMKTIGTTQQTA